MQWTAIIVDAPAPPWPNGFPVEIVCDVPRRSSRGIRGKISSDDGSFVFDDFELTGFARRLDRLRNWRLRHGCAT
jgi:hypothetical protein